MYTPNATEINKPAAHRHNSGLYLTTVETIICLQGLCDLTEFQLVISLSDIIRYVVRQLKMLSL